MIHFEYKNGNYHCFFVSNKFEPYLIVTVVNPTDGPLVKLTPLIVKDLQNSVNSFIASHKIVNETYHYTTLAERMGTKNDGFDNSNKSHSVKFHLKLRVPSDFIPMHMKSMQMLQLGQLRFVSFTSFTSFTLLPSPHSPHSPHSPSFPFPFTVYRS